MSGLETRIERSSKGRFSRVNLMGEGTTARVFSAIDNESHAAVALKVCTASNPERREQLRREYEALAKIRNHPNVIQTLGFEIYNGMACLILEHADTNLGELLDMNDHIELEEALRIAAEAANGVSAIHAAGYVHRDLHPRNILFQKPDVVKVSDFGLIQNPSHVTKSTHGPQVYMAPEQFAVSGSAIAKQPSDIYALGAILYRMVTGKLPFTETTEQQLVQQKTDLSYVQSLISNVDPSLALLLSKCLAPQMDDRYQTAQDFRSALGAVREQALSVQTNGTARTTQEERRVEEPPEEQLVQPNVIIAGYEATLAGQEEEMKRLRSEAREAGEKVRGYVKGADRNETERKRLEEAARGLEARLRAAEKDKVRLEEELRSAAAQTNPTPASRVTAAPVSVTLPSTASEMPGETYMLRYRKLGGLVTDVHVQLPRDGPREAVVSELEALLGITIPTEPNRKILRYTTLKRGNLLDVTDALIQRYGREVLESIVSGKSPAGLLAAQITSEGIYGSNRRSAGEEERSWRGTDLSGRHSSIGGSNTNSSAVSTIKPELGQAAQAANTVATRPPRVLDLPYRVRYTTTDGTRNPNRCDRIFVEMDRTLDADHALGKIAFGIYGITSPDALSYLKKKVFPIVKLKKGALVDVTEDILELYGKETLQATALKAVYLQKSQPLQMPAIVKEHKGTVAAGLAAVLVTGTVGGLALTDRIHIPDISSLFFTTEEVQTPLPRRAAPQHTLVSRNTQQSYAAHQATPTPGPSTTYTTTSDVAAPKETPAYSDAKYQTYKARYDALIQEVITNANTPQNTFRPVKEFVYDVEHNDPTPEMRTLAENLKHLEIIKTWRAPEEKKTNRGFGLSWGSAEKVPAHYMRTVTAPFHERVGVTPYQPNEKATEGTEVVIQAHK